MKKTLNQIIKEAKEYLQGDFTLEDIFILIEDTYHLQRYQILSEGDKELDDCVLEKVKQCVKTPVSYILGYRDFYGYRFKVNKDVLIPRYETEELVDLVLKDIKKTLSDKLNIIDVGTGSGCIAITLDKELDKLKIDHHIMGVDISSAALKVANDNKIALNSNVELLESDIFSSVKGQIINILVSNPPYIKRGSYVSSRVEENEPTLALYAEENGLSIYRKIMSQAKKYFISTLYFEISPDLQDGLIDLAMTYLRNYQVSFYKDMNGLLRFMKVSI